MPQRVLVVDDERGVRESIRMLLKESYEVSLAVNGRDALAKISEVQPDIVLLDLRMPDIGGIEVLQNIKARDPQVEVILVTAYATIDTARKAIRLGAFDYLTKPFNPQELKSIVRRGIERREEVLTRSARMEAMQQQYQSLREEIEKAKLRIATHVRDTIYALLMSLELRDAYSGQHSMAVLWLVDQFSQRLGVAAEDRRRLKCAALIHDLGKIGISEEILNKPGALGPEEWASMQHHPILSAEIISQVEALAELAPIVRSHHERWDGRGYPDHLVGEQIPWQAQMLAVCDSVHAMSSHRCYRARLPEADIRRELQAQRGQQFNPEVVDSMLATTLIAEIYQAEDAGHLVLAGPQIRQVLEESMIEVGETVAPGRE